MRTQQSPWPDTPPIPQPAHPEQKMHERTLGNMPASAFPKIQEEYPHARMGETAFDINGRPFSPEQMAEEWLYPVFVPISKDWTPPVAEKAKTF